MSGIVIQEDYNNVLDYLSSVVPPHHAGRRYSAITVDYADRVLLRSWNQFSFIFPPVVCWTIWADTWIRVLYRVLVVEFAMSCWYVANFHRQHIHLFHNEKNWFFPDVASEPPTTPTQCCHFYSFILKSVSLHTIRGHYPLNGPASDTTVQNKGNSVSMILTDCGTLKI